MGGSLSKENWIDLIDWTKRQKDKRTKGQRDKETKEQRGKWATGHRKKGTKGKD